MNYSVDTSAWIAAWKEHYPRAVFPRVWSKIEEMIGEGRIQVIDRVGHELAAQDDELRAWFKKHSSMLVTPDPAIQQRAAEILVRFPSLTQTKGKMHGDADAFVIALAQERGLTVVQTEHKKPSKPKIPDACEALGVTCTNWVGLFVKEGWREP